jgi:thioredoxin 1
MNNAITLTESNFKGEVLDSDLPVLVDYWAPWCGPCRVMAPVLDQIAAERAGSLKLRKVNVDEEMGLAQDAGAYSIPFLVLYRDGAPVSTVTGAMPKHLLERELDLDAVVAGVG